MAANGLTPEPILVSMPPATSLTDRIAVITGAASGMGAASAHALRAEGAKVVLVDRDATRLARVASDVGATQTFIGDVGDSAFCGDVIAQTVVSSGRLDILVNAAGIIVRATAVTTSDADWTRIFKTNVNGVFYMCRAALRVMETQQSGTIVNFGSIWGDVGSPGHTAYTATKGAVHQMTRSMAVEHARHGIRVNAVCPGEIDTPMLSSGRNDALTQAELDSLADTSVPMGRLGRPEEVASVVAFLASDAASYMTGSIVVVDAGYTAR